MYKKPIQVLYISVAIADKDTRLSLSFAFSRLRLELIGIVKSLVNRGRQSRNELVWITYVEDYDSNIRDVEGNTATTCRNQNQRSVLGSCNSNFIHNIWI